MPLSTETHTHLVKDVGFDEEHRVIIRFDDGPVDGLIILSGEEFEKIFDDWLTHGKQLYRKNPDG